MDEFKEWMKTKPLPIRANFKNRAEWSDANWKAVQKYRAEYEKIFAKEIIKAKEEHDNNKRIESLLLLKEVEQYLHHSQIDKFKRYAISLTKAKSIIDYDLLQYYWYQGASRFIMQELKKEGFTRYHKSSKESTGSIYYQKIINTKKGINTIRIRISDHYIPETDERQSKKTVHKFEIILNSPIEIKYLINELSELKQAILENQ